MGLTAEDMCIAFMTAPSTRETSAKEALLFAMQHAKVCESHWQFSVGSREMTKQKTMCEEVIGLESVWFLPIDYKREELLIIASPHTIHRKQILMKCCRSNDFLKASERVLSTQEISQRVVDASAMR